MLRTARQVIDGAGRLPLRIGVNRGNVFAGGFGPDFRRTYSVKGDAMNLAARVMGKADPGEVLATPRGSSGPARRSTPTRCRPSGQGQGAARPAARVGALGRQRGEAG